MRSRLAVENAVGHGVADVVDFATADLTDGAEFPVGRPPAGQPALYRHGRHADPAGRGELRALGALDGGPDGLDVIRRLIAQLPETLRERGVALLEIGSDQADAALATAGGLGEGGQSVVHDDLGERPASSKS